MTRGVLVPVRGEDPEEAGAQLAKLVDGKTAHSLVYVLGPAGTEPVTCQTLDYLFGYFAELGWWQPQLYVLHALPVLGWDIARVAAAPGLEVLSPLHGVDTAEEDSNLLERVNAARSTGGLPPLRVEALGPAPGPGRVPARGPPPPGYPSIHGSTHVLRQEGEVAWDPDAPLSFNKVAVGGTFDRLHAGHMFLLAATAAVARHEIYVGVTSDKLLQKKARKELLQPYDVRAAAAVEYMRAVNPGVVVTAGTLRDPAEPPAATTDPDYDGIVVSEETVPGALKINADRAALGFKPLAVVVIGIVLTPGASGGKLSSTDLRMSE